MKSIRPMAVLALLAVLLVAGTADSGLVGKSEYDVVWNITVIDCNGFVTVYRDCRITNAGQFWISFMPDQGRLASGNGKEIHINTVDSCLKVIKRQVDG